MRLIIEADDFGLSESITKGIIDGINGGYITSTNIMANMPFAKYAVEKAVKNNIKSVGLHFNLTAGKPLTKNPLLTDENGIFLYNRKQIENPNLTYESVYKEMMAQIKQIEKFSKGKLKLNHITCHHHLGDNAIIKQVVYDITKLLNLPIRREDYSADFDINKPDLFYKDFSMKNVNIDCLRSFIEKYSNTNLTIELLSHPGYIDDYTKTITSYLDRDKELNTLKQAKDEGLFDKIQLIDYSALN